MPKLSPEVIAERRQHIMSAAMRCFERQGLATSTVDEICAEAEVSKGAFYTHFDSKDGLIQTIMETRKAAIELTCTSIAEFEDMIVETLLAPGYSGAAARVDLEAMAISSSNPTLRHLMFDNQRRIREQLSQNVEQLQERGLISADVEPRSVATALLCFLIGKMAIQLVDSQKLTDARRDLRDLLHILLPTAMTRS